MALFFLRMLNLGQSVILPLRQNRPVLRSVCNLVFFRLKVEKVYEAKAEVQVVKDILSKERRSWLMSRVRGKNTTPERVVRSALHKAGYRFRLFMSDLPGKPDIVLPKYKVVIFVNGCFWHQHPGCKKATIPRNNRKFWQSKLTRTIARDRQDRTQLRRLGWKVITLWECQINASIDKTMKRINKLAR